MSRRHRSPLALAENMDTSRILKIAVLQDGRTAALPEAKKTMYQYVPNERSKMDAGIDGRMSGSCCDFSTRATT
jgi:hypothetical protein